MSTFTIDTGKPLPKGVNGASQRVALHLRAAGVDRPGGTPFVTWSPPSAPKGRQIYVHVTKYSASPEQWAVALAQLPWRASIKRLDRGDTVRFVISPHPKDMP